MTIDKKSSPQVYLAIAAVAGEIAQTGIAKDRKNQQQGYNFRGIDEVYNSMAPLLAKHGLVILPNVVDRIAEEREAKSGGKLFSVTVKCDFAFVSAQDGSTHHVVTYGEAMDSGDKATNKAMSAAYKYACMQAFCIPTEGDNDADATTHELKSSNKPSQGNQQKPAARNQSTPASTNAQQANPFKDSEARRAWMLTVKASLEKAVTAEAFDTWLAENGANIKHLGESQQKAMNDLINAQRVKVEAGTKSQPQQQQTA